MSEALLDANALLALAWPNHEHHEAVQAWRKSARMKWATCSFTQIAFVRLSSNPYVVDPVATPQQAADLLRKMLRAPAHKFWPDSTSLEHEATWPPVEVFGYKQVTDAHLLRLAHKHDGKIVTFDRSFARLAGKSRAVLLA